MDFVKTLRLLGSYFRSADGEWAVVGGLALSAYGAGRLTHDIDIVVRRATQRDLVEHLETRGYETLHVSEGYSNHVNRDPELGRVDVVYVDENTARQLFGDARREELFAGTEVRVPSPEHLVAMKVLAAKNDRSRRLQELADVVALLRATGLAAEAVRDSFVRHGMTEAWEQVRDGL